MLSMAYTRVMGLEHKLIIVILESMLLHYITTVRCGISLI